MRKNIKLPPCPICRTRKFRKNATGNYVCKYGHQLANYQEEEAEEGTSTSNLREIRQKKTKIVKEKRMLSGARSRFVYHQMFQQCLRKLVRVLITKFAAPADLEIVVREIWLLYVSHSTIHFQYRRKGATSQQSSVPDEELDMLEDENEDDGAREDKDIVKEANTLSFEDAMFSSTPGRGGSQWPGLAYPHLLVFCYLGCMWLRWPIFLSDLHRWAIVEKIPYSSIIKELPMDILGVVPTVKLRHVKNIPNMPVLYACTRQWLGCFQTFCKLSFPDINYAPLVHRAIREMMLPVEAYTLAMHILSKFGPRPGQFPPLDAQRRKEHGNLPYLIVVCPVDVKIMAAVVFLAKFYYKLNDADSNDLEDLAAYIPPKDVWLNALKANVHRWENNLLNRGRKLPEENDPDEANLRDMAEMFKQITHPDLYNKNVADNVLLKLLRQYVKNIENKRKHSATEERGPLKKRRRSSNWEEGSTFTAIRDPYVRSAASDIKNLYHPMVESPKLSLSNGSTRPHDKLPTTISDADSLHGSDSDSEGDVHVQRNTSRERLAEQSASNAVTAESTDNSYCTDAKVGKDFQVLYRYLDVNYEEYDFVADFASKLVGLTKSDLIKVELSLESYLRSKCLQIQQKVKPARKERKRPKAPEAQQ